MWNLRCKTQFSRGTWKWRFVDSITDTKLFFMESQFNLDSEWNRYWSHCYSCQTVNCYSWKGENCFAKKKFPVIPFSYATCWIGLIILHVSCCIQNVSKFYSESNISKKCRVAIHSPTTNPGQCQMSRSQKGAVDADGKFLKIKSRYFREKDFLL